MIDAALIATDETTSNYDNTVAALEQELAEWRQKANTEHENHVYDVCKISMRLNEEAVRHGWCSEFVDLLNNVNDRLFIDLDLPEREFNVSFDVTFRITTTVRALDEDEAYETAKENFDPSSLEYEYDYDFSSAYTEEA